MARDLASATYWAVVSDETPHPSFTGSSSLLFRRQGLRGRLPRPPVLALLERICSATSVNLVRRQAGRSLLQKGKTRVSVTNPVMMNRSLFRFLVISEMVVSSCLGISCR